ncbi:MAG: PD-(D/E)XK nuclease family protein [Flavobacteriales bacterium]|nr:PD-(D/E)XK nuclease family protein [Flavobacteriales bacterium]
MTESLFKRTFSYRQRENHSPLENYLTEIFAYCIESDLKFRNDFHKKLLNISLPKKIFKITTQHEYIGIGRPDIEINFDNTTIIIESKVEARERLNQLADYCKILKIHKSDEQKHIVLLSKYYEHREIQSSNVTLHLLRWFDIYNLIENSHNEITQQLKIFLKEQGMEKIKNFNIQDMLAMKTIPETITKMDEVLEHFKPQFEKNFGGFSKDSSRSTRLPGRCYINYVTLNWGKFKYWLLIGFFWWDDEIEIPNVGLSVEIPKKEFNESQLETILDKELLGKKGWELHEYDTIYYYSALKPLTEFITKQDDNIPSINKFIDSNLKILLELQSKFPQLFKK